MENEMYSQQEDTQYGRYLTFFLADEVYGIEIKYVTEIIGIQPITTIPEVADFIKGVINLRGKIIPVIDMRIKFRKPTTEYDDRTCVIIVETEDLILGLIVDRVADVMTINDEDIAPPPSHKSGIKNKYIRGIGKVGGEIKLLLDCDMLFNEEEKKEISEIE